MEDRLYTFRYFRGTQMVSANHVRLENDARAIELAREAMFGFDIEVWEDGTYIYGSEGRPPRQTGPQPVG